jgi:hypothetical protein
MLKMEYEIDRKKVENAGQYLYESIVKALKENIDIHHLVEEKEGVIVGTGTRHDFACLGKLYLYLEGEEWFVPYLSKWLLYVGEEVDNLLEDYKGESVA